MAISRRDFLKYCFATAGTLGLQASGLIKLQEVLANESGPSVVWLQAQSCSGCSVSLLNSIHYATIDDLLINTLDLNFHSTVMSAAGDLAVGAAEAARAAPGYVLVVEGAIPTAAGGEYCYLWPGMTAHQAVQVYSRDASFILAVGTCAAYGGIPGGAGNLTNAKGVSEILGKKAPVINLPGCPAHPDWIVGTIVHLLTQGEAPRLDSDDRPRDFYPGMIHNDCPNKKNFVGGLTASQLGELGCLSKLGCQGRATSSDCPMRQWNSAGVGQHGVNWCIGAGAPCQGCTEPDFPDGMSPFYTLEAAL
jgi:hydrogenase small subunit